MGGVLGGRCDRSCVRFIVVSPCCQSTSNTSSPPEKTEPIAKVVTPTNSVTTQPPTKADKAITPEDILGHLPYEEVSQSILTSVSADGRVKLHNAAAQKFIQMQAAARS